MSELSKVKPKERQIDNVRFSEAIFLRGAMQSNVKQGWMNSVISEDRGGVLIEIPPAGEAPQFVTLVPWSKIKQVEFIVD